jgi:transposase InsO family protein
MAREVVAMDVRLRIAVASDELNVSEFCRQHGISRQTFYQWRRRYRVAGLKGLEARSRAPRRSRHRIHADTEEAIVAVRKELSELGVDAGPGTIQWHLDRRGHRSVPSQATIWRTLVRRGFVVPEPRKRPKRSYCRFEASVPNELWQADCIDWVIATGQAKILSFLDDHSRVALRVKALAEATTEATWQTFCEASAAWGVPLGQLSDNGLNFSGRLRGFEVRFEIELRAIGVVPKTSRPYHPQTCGKVERFQQTVKKWLRRQPLAADLAGLQAQLDAFVGYYNHHRPHRGIGRVTPVERWMATPPAINLGTALPGPANAVTVVVGQSGVIDLNRRYQIGVGQQWRGRTARVHYDDTHAAVFIDHKLIRALVFDPTRRYQPTGRPPGRRPSRPRITEVTTSIAPPKRQAGQGRRSDHRA